MFKHLYHYAHALDTRFFQLYELSLMKSKSGPFDSNFRKQVWKHPGSTEDWVNLARFIDPDDRVLLVDIGANVGDFTAEFLSIYRNARSICCEPVSSTYNVIADRFDSDPRIELRKCAVSDKDGTAAIEVHGNNTLSTLVQYSERANDAYQTHALGSENTDCRRLDSMEIRNEDGERLFIKIDVNGGEFEVLRGGMQTLSRADVVLLECNFADEYTNREPSFSPCCSMLHECGLYPIVFQDFGRGLSNYAFERDVLFVKRELLSHIWFANYPAKVAS